MRKYKGNVKAQKQRWRARQTEKHYFLRQARIMGWEECKECLDKLIARCGKKQDAARVLDVHPSALSLYFGRKKDSYI